MTKCFQSACLALAVAGVVSSASAFSMLGPFDTWQTAELGYNPRGFDIGGPMNLGEEYRWNVRKITYGFDASFLNYFGARGTAAVMQAVAVLNALPAMSQMSSNLAEFPLQAKGNNRQAGALHLLDLKSYALAVLMEEMGLASPERYVWTLRDRRTIQDVVWYTVINRNFDPVTFSPSKFVNGVLYTYAVESRRLSDGTVYYEAAEHSTDPKASSFAAVSAAEGDAATIGGVLYYGEYFNGLTRDDVGGLRYIYRSSNWNTEDLVPDTTLRAGGSSNPWDPPGTIGVTNGEPAGVALRKGVDKIEFVLGANAGGLGNFLTITNTYQDNYFDSTNGGWMTQSTERVLTQPDIMFTAEDLGLDDGGSPIGIRRTETTTWANNSALNGQAALAGPGVILPTVVIAFSKVGAFIYNSEESNLDEKFGTAGFVWGSFDGTTNAPVIYPDGVTIQDLERQIMDGY